MDWQFTKKKEVFTARSLSLSNPALIPPPSLFSLLFALLVCSLLLSHPLSERFCQTAWRHWEFIFTLPPLSQMHFPHYLFYSVPTSSTPLKMHFVVPANYSVRLFQHGNPSPHDRRLRSAPANTTEMALCSKDCSSSSSSSSSRDQGDSPICGSDLKTYRNKCELHKARLCRRGQEELRFLHKGECSEGVLLALFPCTTVLY